MDTIARLLVFAEKTEFGFECVERWLSRSGSDESLRRLGRQARSVRAAAGELAERLWDRNGHRSSRDLARAVTSRKSMVFEMPMDISSQHVPARSLICLEAKLSLFSPKDDFLVLLAWRIC